MTKTQEETLKSITISQENNPFDFEEREKYCFVAKRKDKIVAFASMVRQEEFGANWIFRDCQVNPRYRGLGLQRKLIQARIEFAKTVFTPYLDWRHFIAFVRPKNQYSLNNLISEGFLVFQDELVKFKGAEHIQMGKTIEVCEKS